MPMCQYHKEQKQLCYHECDGKGALSSAGGNVVDAETHMRYEEARVRINAQRHENIEIIFY